MDAPLPFGLVPAIEELFESGFDPPEELISQKIFNDNMTFPLQRKRELVEMLKIAKEKKPQTIYEIGTDRAGGLFHWCWAIPTVKNVIACEIRGTPYKHVFERFFPNINFLWLDGTSSYDPSQVNVVKEWLQLYKTTIDVLFIDGDKSHFHTDFYRYLPLMTPNGVVFMHDVTDPSPGESYRTVVENTHLQTKVIHDTSESSESEQRQQSGIPPANGYEEWLRHWKGRSCGVGVIYL